MAIQSNSKFKTIDTKMVHRKAQEGCLHSLHEKVDDHPQYDRKKRHCME